MIAETIMRTKLVRIGSSRGVRLPKPVLEASGITDQVEIAVENGRVVLMRPEWRPPEGWAVDARRMIANRDDCNEADWSDWESKSGEALEEDWDWPEDFKWPEAEIVSRFISPSSTPSEARKSLKRGHASSSRPRR